MTAKQWIMLGVAKVVLIAVAVGIVFSIYGCGTVHGIGQDIERGGKAMQRSTSPTVRGMGQDIEKVGESVQKSSD